MIKIDFREPTSEDWREWRRECDAARDELVDCVRKGQKPKITNLYKDPRMKEVYKSGEAPFHGKCVYCETNVAASHPGDIEHWRPKNRVTDEAGRAIEIETENGSMVQHPGYYWLAYEWRNLLFSCEDCNRPSTAKTPGRRIGKWDQFPVRGFRATRKDEELREHPMLLNPVEEDPVDHLEVDDIGVMIPKTDRGKACIDIFGLNAREALLGARRECIENTRSRIQMMVLEMMRAHSQHDKENAMRKYSEKVKRIESGEVPYSACERLVLRECDENLKRLSDRS